MPTFDLNNEDSIEYVAKLEKLHRSAFPSAVRNTLNQAALDMKKTQILKSSLSNFKTVRSKSFFRKYTTAEKATGFEIPRMVAKVGFQNKDNNIAASKAISGMEKHEKGGSVRGGYAYAKGSRITGSSKRLVRKKNIFNSNNVVSGFEKGSFPTKERKKRNWAMIKEGHKQGKAFWLNTKKGVFLAEVKSFNEKQPRNTKLNFLMRERQKPVNISANKFMTEAADYEKKQIPLIFKEKAEFQFKKFSK